MDEETPAGVYKITLLYLALNATVVYGNGCPAFWIRVDSLCYRLVSSVGVDTLGFPTIYHARAACKQYGGDLAYIDNMDSENGILGIMRNMSIDSVPRKVYIGLVDRDKTRHFTWINGQNVTYTDWAEGEPGNKQERCVVIKSPYRTWLSPEETEWHDYPCCKQVNIKHALCSRAIFSDDANDTEEGDIFEVMCNTVNECNSNPCRNGGTCHDFVHGYVCSCRYGYEGNQCQRELTCPLPNLEGARLGDIAENLDKEPRYSFGSVMTITCEPGQKFVEFFKPPSRRYNCTEDGWIELHSVVCPPIPKWSGLVANMSSRYYGDVVEYTCEKGMTFADGEQIKIATCNKSGNWTPPLTECIEQQSLLKQIQMEKPVEATGAAVLGVFGLTFLVAEICLFVLMDLNVFRKQFVLGYRNVKSMFRDSDQKGDFHAVPVQL